MRWSTFGRQYNAMKSNLQLSLKRKVYILNVLYQYYHMEQKSVVLREPWDQTFRLKGNAKNNAQRDRKSIMDQGAD